MKHRPTSNRTQPEAVEIEMIRSLFLAFIPSSVMTAGFIAAGIAIYERTQDAILLGLLITGAIASSARLAVAWRLAVKAADPRLSLAEAQRLERRFAVPYLAFAVILGLFGARAFSIPARGWDSMIRPASICPRRSIRTSRPASSGGRIASATGPTTMKYCRSRSGRAPSP